MPSKRQRYEAAASAARERWIAAIDAGREHYEVERFWVSYLAAAKLAGYEPHQIV